MCIEDMRLQLCWCLHEHRSQAPEHLQLKVQQGKSWGMAPVGRLQTWIAVCAMRRQMSLAVLTRSIMKSIIECVAGAPAPTGRKTHWIPGHAKPRLVPTLSRQVALLMHRAPLHYLS
jgi:hypothetical protein